MSSEDTILLSVKLLFALLALGAVVLYVVLPVLRMIRRTEEVEQVMKPFEPPPEPELQIPVDGFNTGRKVSRAEMLEELRNNPEHLALLLKDAMKEKKRSGGPPKKA